MKNFCYENNLANLKILKGFQKLTMTYRRFFDESSEHWSVLTSAASWNFQIYGIPMDFIKYTGSDRYFEYYTDFFYNNRE